jgi:ribosomal protein S18 acetylase RimI-like enzyme
MSEQAVPAFIQPLDDAVAELLRQTARRTAGGEVHEADGVLAIIGAVPSPTIVNTILTLRPDVTPAAFLQAVELFEARGHGFGLFSRDHADGHLEPTFVAAGLRRVLRLPGMVVEAPLAEPQNRDDRVVIRTVETETDRMAWVTADLAGFAESEDDHQAIESAFGRLPSLVGGGVVGHYAVVDGRPVAASMVGVFDGVGVVGWVGTDPNYRRRGIGTAVTRASTNAAFDLGARIVGLQASPDGYPVYLKMGFRVVAGYAIWIPSGETPETTSA